MNIQNVSPDNPYLAVVKPGQTKREAYVKNGSAKSKIKYGSKNPDPEVEKFYVKKYGIEKMLESKSCLKQKFRE